MKYFEFLQAIKDISQNHVLVNEYGEGDIYEYLNSGEHRYPCIFLTVTNIDSNGTTDRINFTLFYVDRLTDNSSNKSNIQSIGIDVIKQILGRFEALYIGVELVNTNYTPFTEKFSDLCAGVFADISVENIENANYDCEGGDFWWKMLEINENGEYDVFGYDSVYVDVEPIYVEPEKIYLSGNFRINNNCIMNGTWQAEFVDVSNVTNMEFAFANCYSLRQLDVSEWNTWQVKNMASAFTYCDKLTQLDLTRWNASSVTAINLFTYGSGLEDLVGGRTIEEVVNNNITILNGLSVGSMNLLTSKMNRQTYRACINGLADLTDKPTQTIVFGSTALSKLTTEDIAIATAKNWTIY